MFPKIQLEERATHMCEQIYYGIPINLHTAITIYALLLIISLARIVCTYLSIGCGHSELHVP